MFYSQRKILLIGPTGSGKSTLCNAIFNNKVDSTSLKKPAGVSRRATGVTSSINNYWCNESLVVTDTIGFDDPRFKPEKIAEELRRMLKDPNLKYEKVILCMKLGRVSQPARVYLRLLKAIFEDPTSNMILYISGCEDGTTTEQFIQDNGKREDEDLKELINSLNKQTDKNTKKGINLENIITGSLLSHQDNDADERMFMDERKKTFQRIMSTIRTDIGFVRVKPSENLRKAIADWFRWQFKVFSSNLKMIFAKNLVVEFASSGLALEVQYFYGKCSICSDDNNGGWVITKPCLHRFHEDCFLQTTNECPECHVYVKNTCRLP